MSYYERSSSKSRPGYGMHAAVAGVVAVVLFAVIWLFTGTYSVPSDMVAVTVGAGPFEASKVKDVKPPSSRGWFTNDDYKYFPTSEREWDATGQADADSKAFRSVTKDNVEMAIPVTVRFTLRTDGDTIKDFYTRYARRYGAEFKADGTYDETGANYNRQWLTVLRKLVGDPADATLDRIVQDYKWRDVWNDPATKTEITRRLNDELQSDNSLLVQTAKGSFFDGISVLIGHPEPTNPVLAENVATEQANVAKAQSAEAEAKAQIATAKAQTAQARAEAAKQQAEIKGYQLPGMTPAEAIKAYNQAKAIEAGQNPFQPQYVVPGQIQ